MADQPPNEAHISPHELLLWYQNAGVDLALSETPVDQFAASAEQGLLRKKPALEKFKPADRAVPQKHSKNDASETRISNPNSNAAMPDESAVASARQYAKSAGSPEELREIVSAFKGCNLRLSAKNMVFSDGNPAADIMLIGEGPGRDEDIHGLPFVGRAGRLLDSMLSAIELDREKTYLTNIIPWRPPGNRTPTAQEIEICRPFIERHIELINPRLMIILGGAAAKILLNSSQNIVKLRGRWKSYENGSHQIEAMTTFHPANLLGHPTQKKLAWQDLLKIRQKLQGHS